MKYFKADVGTVNGPGGKQLAFGYEKKEITEEEFTKILDDFFEDAQGAQAVVVKQTKELAWDYLRIGKHVTVDDVILSMKK